MVEYEYKTPFLDSSIPQEKKNLAIKVYRLAEMSKKDWESLKLQYQNLSKEWWLIPTCIWIIMSIVGIVLLFLKTFLSWFPAVGVSMIFISTVILSSRKGNLEGFQDGYELGKADGVFKALGINKEQQPEYFELARNLITEFKVETGDPEAELGKSIKGNKR